MFNSGGVTTGEIKLLIEIDTLPTTIVRMYNLLEVGAEKRHAVWTDTHQLDISPIDCIITTTIWKRSDDGSMLTLFPRRVRSLC